MKKFEKTAKKVINKAISIETFGWPPICNGAVYQPARPAIKPKKAEQYELNSKDKL